MCAASLEGVVEATAERVQPPQPERHHREGDPPVEQEGIVCSECNALNEPGWSFCQQCGKRLAQPPPPPPVARTPADFKTIPEQRAAADPMFHGLKTNPEPQPAEHGLKTVVAQPTPVEPPPERPPLVEPDLVPKHQTPAAPPIVTAQPLVAESPANVPDESAIRTVPVETPVQPKPTAPTPPIHEEPIAPAPPLAKPSTAPPPETPSAASVPAATVAGGAMSGALCTQCGQSNTVGSAFCASCGAPITFGGKTMVISSQPAIEVPKGRLHLVMEGGQPGEVYELEADTVIGRSSGEIMFPHDGFMSGRHARIERRGGSFILTDEGSRNGTFIKTKGEVELKSGDMILVGKQLFRFEA